MARMGWNPDSPTNALRVSLLAYLREHLLDLRQVKPYTELEELRRWIAWLDGDEVWT